MSTKRLSEYPTQNGLIVNNERFPVITAIGTTNANVKWDLIKTSLKADFNLTDAEIAQISNIDTATIDSTQWTYLGSTDQHIHSTAGVTFDSVEIFSTVQIATLDASGITVNTAGITLANTIPLKLKGTGFFDADIRMSSGDVLQFSGAPSYSFAPLTNVEIISTSGALIVSRMTTASKNGIFTPQNGMILYDTTLNQFQKRENGAWVATDAHPVNTTDVSNPPTDAELDAIYGTPATVGAGFTGYIDDNGAGANFYQVASDGTNWWIFTGTKAV